ncbi:universal stress protein [Actibacterium sp. 188UL27-1]|uniref:universal stress protein n=1 Tax=Actibacterium sp. 188UL27-1 TaxID=2786961 RepID=UPI00195CD63B|nr:universal stress protein [Actibacterium sp. 188UL27-1]MBM7068400.1 universal stress protein [Actibacterium sp. 188UL27-1]
MLGKTLVAIDLNDLGGARRVAEMAAGLARMQQAELHAINVIPGSGMSIVGNYLGPEHADRMEAEARRALADFASMALEGLPAENLHVTHGTIYDQILRAAAKLGATCIVIGAHRPELKDYLIGPNAARVARHAPQSVFVVR